MFKLIMVIGLGGVQYGPRSGSWICLITSMITDRIGQHEVLLPINHNFNKILWSIRLFFNQNTRNPEIFFAKSEKKAI